MPFVWYLLGLRTNIEQVGVHQTVLICLMDQTGSDAVDRPNTHALGNYLLFSTINLSRMRVGATINTFRHAWRGLGQKAIKYLKDRYYNEYGGKRMLILCTFSRMFSRFTNVIKYIVWYKHMTYNFRFIGAMHKCTRAVMVYSPCAWCVLPRLEFCDKQTQQKWFKRHFELAASLKLPMFLHMRAAAPDFISILKEHRCAVTYAIGKCASPLQQCLYSFFAIQTCSP